MFSRGGVETGSGNVPFHFPAQPPDGDSSLDTLSWRGFLHENPIEIGNGVRRLLRSRRDIPAAIAPRCSSSVETVVASRPHSGFHQNAEKNYMMPTRPHAYQMKISRGPFSYEKSFQYVARYRSSSQGWTAVLYASHSALVTLVKASRT